MMKVLIPGAGGMFSSDLVRFLNELKASRAVSGGLEVVAAPETGLDITDAAKVDAFVAACEPNIIINCAAYTDVDRAEAEPEKALAVNAVGPENLAKSAKRHGAKLVHISTNYVFSGDKGSPYVETDEAQPVNVYGRTKLEGDRRVAEHCPNHLIIRTAWLFGRKGRNFIETMLKLGREKGALAVVADELGSPTFTLDLAAATWNLISIQAMGVFHVANTGVCSRLDEAQAIFDLAGLKVKLTPIKLADYRRAARVPLNSALDCSKLGRVTGHRPRPWRDAIRHYIEFERS
ncbi:MAG: dTDP-4-dehydrorhamnose reductase [Planctomycetes bacterium]|nr:dTDP-4-dehydrorhamnose reductase [Planctomycetota bacterium]